VKKFRPRSIILGIGIAVIVPLICYFILRSAGHTGHVAVPGNYGMDTVIETVVDGQKQYDTVYHTMQDNHFISHLGDSINLAKDFNGKILIINFFNSFDEPNSEKLSYHMSHIQKGFQSKKTDTAIQLISISTGHPEENIQSIREYADSKTHNHDSWTFLLSSQAYANEFASNELFPDRTVSIEKYHPLKQIILIDKFRNIRGYYNGLDSMEIKRCIDDVAFMMVEKNKIHERKRR